MWADNVKFVKDIVDSKYAKIETAAADIAESSEALAKDANCHKTKEHFSSAVRVLELIQTAEIETLLDTILSELSGKEKEMLENEMKEKVAKRDSALEKAKQVKTQLKLWSFEDLKFSRFEALKLWRCQQHSLKNSLLAKTCGNEVLELTIIPSLL